MLKPYIARALNRRPNQEFIWGTQNPEAAYAKLEAEILGVLKQGSYWPKRLGGFSSLSDFPLTEYEDYRQTLNDHFNASHSPFTGEKFEFWCLTSGTSADPKVFPLTETYRNQLLRITKAYTYQLAAKIGPGFNKPLIFFPAVASGRTTEAGVEVGYISRFMFLRQPKMIRKGYAIPEEVFQKAEYLWEWGPLYGISTDVCSIMAIVPAFMGTYFDIIEKRKEELFNILAGSRPWPKGLPPRKISRERLKTVERAFSRTNFVLKELWPGLELIISWKSSTAGLQLGTVEKYNQGRVLHCDAIYSATEGWVTVPLFKDGRTGCPMHMGSTYVEFLPEGAEVNAKHLLKPWELRPGQKYEVFLSQAMGFARYRLFDVLQCNEYFNRSPVLEFVYKSGNNVAMGNVRYSDATILKAVEDTRFHHSFEWTIAPAADGTGMIFYTTRVTSDLADKVRRLDDQLAADNPVMKRDYEKGLMKRLQLRELDFHHPFWVKGRHAQAKMKVLTTTVVEALP